MYVEGRRVEMRMNMSLKVKPRSWESQLQMEKGHVQKNVSFLVIYKGCACEHHRALHFHRSVLETLPMYTNIYVNIYMQ